MSSTKSHIEISAKNLQSIYDILKPAANLVRMNSNVSEEDKKKFEKAPADLFLSQTEATQYAVQIGSPFGFSWNENWYGDAQTLSSIYSQIVEIDKADGKFDGKILQKNQPYSLFFESIDQVNWNAITSPLTDGVLIIFRTLKRGGKSSGGTAWIMQRERLDNGQWRYYLATNAHSADDEADHEVSHEVTLPGSNRDIEVTLLGVDHTWDCAFLYFDSEEDFPVLTPAPDAPVNVNDPIMIIGNQLGNGIIQTSGKVNAIAKYPDGKWPVHFIQDGSNAAPGNSGSPVLNAQGEVIAVHNSSQGSKAGYNIPISYFLRSFEQIKEKGFAEHAHLHMSYEHLDRTSLKAENVDTEKYSNGFYIENIKSNRALSNAGIQIGDIILTYDGQPMPIESEKTKFDAYISEKEPGETITLTIYRNGEIKEVQVTLDGLIKNQLPTYVTPYDFNLVEMDSDQKINNNFPDMPGLVYQITSSQNTGNRPYYLGILKSINGKNITTIEDAKAILTDPSIENFVITTIYWRDGTSILYRREFENVNR